MILMLAHDNNSGTGQPLIKKRASSSSLMAVNCSSFHNDCSFTRMDVALYLVSVQCAQGRDQARVRSLRHHRTEFRSATHLDGLCHKPVGHSRQLFL